MALITFTGCRFIPVETQNIIHLKQWQWYFYEVEKDSQGKYNFSAMHDSLWQQSEKSILENNGKNIFWLRTQLPQWSGTLPAIFVNRTSQILQVYLHDSLIFDNTKYINSLSEIVALENRWFLIELPPFSPGENIYFRLYSEHNEIGIPAPVSFGSASYFLHDIVAGSTADIIIGVLITVAGFIMLAIFVFVKREKFYFGIAVFFFSLGIWVCTNNPYIYFLFQHSYYIFFLNYYALYFTPAFFMAVEYLYAERYKKIIQWTWKVHVIFLAVGTPLLLFPKIHVDDLLTPFFILMMLTSNTVVVLLFKSVSRNNIDALIVLAGTIVFSLCGTTEILIFYANVFSQSWYTTTYVLQWGGLFFTVTLIALAVYRYLYDIRLMQQAQEEAVLQQRKATEAVQHEVELREEYTHKLLHLQDAERKHLSLELHDAIGQELLIIKNMAQLWLNNRKYKRKQAALTEYIKDISSTATSLIDNVRDLSRHLHPYQLEGLGLTETLETLIYKVLQRHEIKFQVRLVELDGIFSRQNELHIYRIVQELLNNIIKHSQATTVKIVFVKEKDRITIQAVDNGKGFAFSPNQKERSAGLGLTGIQERVNILNGILTIDSSHEKGTAITITIPQPAL